MEWFIAVFAIVLLGVAAMAAAGGMGEMSREPVRDVYRQKLPDRLLTAADVHSLRFGVTLRGYAMSQVDDLLDRLAAEIAERDARIAELSAGRLHPEAPTAPELPQSYADPDGSSSAR
jgi:DivIVA domain-containing protein